jgi:hypothetical protein
MVCPCPRGSVQLSRVNILCLVRLLRGRRQPASAGYSNDTADGNGEVVTYNGTSWSAPQQTGIPGIVSGISCATTAFCAVIDKSGHAVAGVTQPRAQTNPARNRTSP